MHLTPPQELTIVHAAEQREAWLAAAADTSVSELALDLSQVSDVDSAGLQLLLSLHKTLALQGRTLRLDHPSATLQASLGTLGLGPTLQPMALAA
jgi:anti-sigma B factor antagonist